MREDPELVRERLEAQMAYLGELNDRFEQRLDKWEERLPTSEELKHWREIAREHERATWLKKKLAIAIPAGSGIAVGTWKLWEWFRAHVIFR